MLRLLVIAMAMFIGMGFVVPQKAEAGYVWHYINHNAPASHFPEGGRTGIRPDGYIYGYQQSFTLNSSSEWKTIFWGMIKNGWAFSWAIMNCGKYQTYWVYVGPWTQVYFYL